jgi:hypothetical protein
MRLATVQLVEVLVVDEGHASEVEVDVVTFSILTL